MSKKNSSVIVRNNRRSQDDTHVFNTFESKLDNLKNKSYAVAVSGGPDSLALTSLCQAYGLKKKIKFYYVLVNHNIRKSSTKESLKVKLLLKKHNIFLNILTNKLKIKKNIQGLARNIRYKLLSKFCYKKNIKIILTAHNLEDQVETFFIRLSRGSGLTGLSAMKTLSNLDKNLKICRPLLAINKKELIKISKKKFGKYFKDPSNIDRKYLRTKIRSLQKPLKESGIEYYQIIRSINNLASSKKILDDYYSEISKKVIKKKNVDIFINLKKFKNLSNEIKLRIINDSIKLVKNNYYNPRSKKVVNLIKKVESKNFSKLTLAGCIFIRKKQYLSLKLEKK